MASAESRCRRLWTALLFALSFCLIGCKRMPSDEKVELGRQMLDYDTPVDPTLQMRIEEIDSRLRTRFEMTTEQVAPGVLDLLTGRVAMIHPDREAYAASVAKIGILLAYFALRPEAANSLDAQTRHDLGLMVKASRN